MPHAYCKPENKHGGKSGNLLSPFFPELLFTVRLQLCKSLAAEQRVKQIILQPCPQSNVPAAPELLNGFGEKGAVKVLGERNPQCFRQTDGNIHAAGKIRIKLEGKAYGGYYDVKAPVGIRIPVNRIHHHRQTLRND